jgi:hypothetical protein
MNKTMKEMNCTNAFSNAELRTSSVMKYNGRSGDVGRTWLDAFIGRVSSGRGLHSPVARRTRIMRHYITRRTADYTFDYRTFKHSQEYFVVAQGFRACLLTPCSQRGRQSLGCCSSPLHFHQLAGSTPCLDQLYALCIRYLGYLSSCLRSFKVIRRAAAFVGLRCSESYGDGFRSFGCDG